MSRPDFPNPYTPLTGGMISRIRSDQEHYDRDPERAEREQREQHERQEEERRQEQEYYENNGGEV